jgi:hypothetical protein
MNLSEAYRALGLDPATATPAVAKATFRSLMQSKHPDKHLGDARYDESVAIYIAAYRLIQASRDATEFQSMRAKANIRSTPTTLRYRSRLDFYPLLPYASHRRANEAAMPRQAVVVLALLTLVLLVTSKPAL